MENLSPYLIWAAIGLILIVVEMMTGTFILLSFGIAALLVAAVSFFGLGPVYLQVVLFAGFGLIVLALIRQKKGKTDNSPTFLNDRNQSFVIDSSLSQPLLAGEEGTVSYQGSPWTACNVGTTTIRAGQKVIITKLEGIKIYIKAFDEA